MIGVDEVEALTNELALPIYDVLLIGDGSGTVASKASAWSCFKYTPINKKLELHFGANTFGTNNYAELIPYISLLWLDHYEGHRLPRRIQVVSDSEMTVKCGIGSYQRTANLPLWNSLDYFENLGYNIQWKHVARNSNAFSRLCDLYAGKLRVEIEKFQLTASEESDRIEVSKRNKP